MAVAVNGLVLLGCLLGACAALQLESPSSLQPPRLLTRKERQANKAKADAVKHKFQDVEDLKKKTGWGRPVLAAPKHVQAKAQRAVDAWFATTSFVKRGSCASTILAKSLGLKHPGSLLQAAQHPGQDSWSKPGAGVEQVMKDGDLSKTGQIFGAKAQTDQATVLAGGDPFVSVLKDGFYEVGCYDDVMLEKFDKYSDNKFKYNGEPGNVSIVAYKEHVLDEEMRPMTPEVCFEFCRTVPNMVFFGINNGMDCYCTPYYKQTTGDGKQCDVPCAGDTTRMCGNKVKSTIWEMHLCANTGEVLKEAMVKAKAALDFYFEDAVMANELASQMTRSGVALEKVGGLSGGPGAGDMGMVAKTAAKDLSQAYIKGFKTYQELLKAYTDATSVKGADFSSPADASLAEEAIRTMKKTTTPVMEFASEMHSLVKLAYPPVDTATFGDDPDPTDPVSMKLATEGSADGFDFRPASYSWDTKNRNTAEAFVSDSSSCVGPVIGLPIVGLGLKECAKVCEATVFPKTCVVFSFYTLYEDEKVEGKGLSDLCFLLEDIKTLETFQCPTSLAQASALRGAQNATAARGTAHGEFECFVKMSQVSTGYKPASTAEWKKYNRCVKSTNDQAVEVPDAFQIFKMPEVTKMEAEGKDTIAAPP